MQASTNSDLFHAMVQSSIERRFPNTPQDLSRVMIEVGGFLEALGIGGQTGYVTNLAVEELATNILKYGYDDTVVHEILLRVDVEPGAVRLLLEDDGHPFNPLDLPEPDVHLPTEDREPGGLGIHLIRKLSDRMDYQRANGRNRVTVRIRR